MADVTPFYPPNPTNVPPDLTTPPGSYRSRVVLVLFSLLVFVVVYLLLTAGSAYACYYCFSELAREEPRPAAYTAPPAGTRTGYRPAYIPPPPRREKPVFWLILGGAVVGRSSKRIVAVMEQAAKTPEGPQKAALMQEAGVLRQRLQTFGTVVLVCQLIALVLMAVGHYI